MDFHKFITRYKQFGGAKLVWQYAKLGILPVVLRGVVRCVVKRQSFKAIYPEVLYIIEPFLIQKYGLKVQEFKKFKWFVELTICSRVQEIFGCGFVFVSIY